MFSCEPTAERPYQERSCRVILLRASPTLRAIASNVVPDSARKNGERFGSQLAASNWSPWRRVLEGPSPVRLEIALRGVAIDSLLGRVVWGLVGGLLNIVFAIWRITRREVVNEALATRRRSTSALRCSGPHSWVRSGWAPWAPHWGFWARRVGGPRSAKPDRFRRRRVSTARVMVRPGPERCIVV